ncbi:MAG: hypothetical protein RL483_909 [Pseudomonadota bacterium]
MTAAVLGGLVALPPLPSLANIDKRQAYTQIENGQVQAVKSRLQEELRKNPANLQAANDLAAVLIAEDQDDAARSVLEAALLAHPNTSDTFKNLRELAARQYAQAYAKAMGTQSKRKDEPIRGAQLDPQQVKRALTLAQARADEAARQAKQAKLAAEKAEADRLAKVAAAEQAAKASAPATVAKSETTQVAAAPAATPAPTASANDEQNVKQAVLAWAESWEKKNFKKYAGFYSETFKASKFSSKEAWIDYRRPRVMNKGRIVVRVDNIESKVVGTNTREVKFLQRYESGSLRVRTTKKQIWVLEGSVWRIRSEES